LKDTRMLDTSNLERIAAELDHGSGSRNERVREFCQRFPVELANVRRQVYQSAGQQAGLHPVPINGSIRQGLNQGYYSTPLHDGTRGFLQRRTDDCDAASLATL